MHTHTTRGGRPRRWLPHLRILLKESKLGQKDQFSAALLRGQQAQCLVCYGLHSGNANNLPVGRQPLWYKYVSFRFVFFCNKEALLLWSWAVENFADLVTPVTNKSYHYSGPSPMRPNKLWTCSDNGAIKAKAWSSFESVRRGRDGQFDTFLNIWPILHDASMQRCSGSSRGSFLGPTWPWSNANTRCFHILPKIDMIIVRTLLEEPRLKRMRNNNEHSWNLQLFCD